MSVREAIYPTSELGFAGTVTTLVDVLRLSAIRQPDLIAFTYLTAEQSQEASLTYSELDQRAGAIAALLQSAVKPGDRVLLLYPPGLDYLAAFFGCLYAGAVAVPAYPPRLNETKRRLEAIVDDALPALALTTSAILPRTKSLSDRPLHSMATDVLDNDIAEQWRMPRIDGDTVAFLQYTSGSTATPKGVIVTHSNLLYNERMIQRAFNQSKESIIVGWLPLYHDMGLIGNLLQPLYLGARCILMSPIDFLRSPFEWLQAISRYGGTTSGGPNFAYDLCVRKISPTQKAKLDLSSWTVAFNGAEPVRAETLDRFAGAFEECGFRREAFRPCYGLAEATLMVSGKLKSNTFTIKPVQAAALEKGRVKEVSPDEKDARLLVGCGTSLLDQDIVIADPNSLTQTPSGQIGEIWVSGQNIARGYWNRPEDTERTFCAFLAGSGDGPFLRTGDLGFIEDRELFITGRLKDLIIIRGLNHYPQDIELTVESSHPSLRPGCGAAFSVDVAGQERLVVVQEVMNRRRTDFDEVIASIQQSVSERHELQPYAVVLIDKGSIPKTSSGKIQRQECRVRFLEGNLKVVAQWLDEDKQDEPARSSETVSGSDSIQNWLLSNLPHGARDLDQPVSRYHLDSLAAIELMHKVEIELGVSLPINSFLQNLTIRELAHQISAEQDRDSATATSATSGDEETRKRGRLSYGQRALWFLHELNPNSPAYNIAVPVQINGDLDMRKLKSAFQALVDRHGSLRTSFSVEGGEPVRHIHDTAQVAFQVCDASRWNQERVDEFLSREAFSPFDLTSDSLLRVTVLSRSKSESILLMVLDHLVADLWSLGLLVDELRHLYSEEYAPADPRKSDYGDYVEWQARFLASAQGEILWQYWKERLSGELPVLNLPVDHPRPASPRFLGASSTISVDAELTQKVISIGQSRGATPYSTLLAAFQTLLSKYTGQHDLLIGSPTTGRTRAAWREIVGYFVNPIVLRTDLSDNPTFALLLERTREEVLSALQHQDFPFALLVDRLQPDRSVNHSPVFQVAFAWQIARPSDSDGLSPFAIGETGGRFEAGDLVFESMALKQRAIQFDLTMMVAQVNGELNVSLQYDVELFEAETIRRMLQHFQTLIAHISENPQTVISDLPILTEKERQQILIDWNDTAIDFDSNLCAHELAHELIAAQAGSRPRATALACDGKYLSYGELNGQANQLARYLSSLGVGPEQRVGVCMQRSAEMVVALFGILKAGAAYVPLDAAYPQLRLQHMVEDSGASVLLVDETGEQKLSGTEAKVVVLTEQWPMISRESRENIESGVCGDNLAYVIYTSGSTGTPKGVAVRHGGLTNLINWHLQTYRVTREDRATQVASPAFDASVWEVWPYLAAGASIWIPDEETRASVAKLIEYLASNEITISFLPTPLAETAIRGEMPPTLSLKTLLTGGDKLHNAPRSGLPFELVNHYGPTENSVVATFAIAKPENSEVEPAIGRPIANTQVYILDEFLQPVAVGVAGEIFIAGAGLARGYLNKADLTAERFIPDPFSKAEGGRMYRTGDVARYLADGNIQFIGRKDQQVKLRGFRIELGEIEAAITAHPLVTEAVVELRDSANGDKSLVAYVAGDEQLTASQIRAHLKKRLPDYMVPSRYVVMDHLPLSANGKLDRRALREMAAVLPESQPVAGPKGKRLGAVAEIVAGICSEVLGLDEVDAEADFFEMGGHSLLAAQVASRVREAFSIDLPLRTIFERPIIFDLSSAVEDKLIHASELPAISRRNVPVNEPLPLSFSQQRVWFLDRLEPGGSVYNIPAAVRLIGNLDVDAFRRALTEIVRRHEALRTVFVEIGAKLTQRIQEPREIELSVVDLSGLNEPDQRQIINRVSEQSFDLSQGPLIRAGLIRLSEQQHIFTLVMHHIVSDGWSMGVLVRELSTLYNAYSAGQQSPFGPLPIQYSDYVLWQREWMSGAVLDQQLSYWKERLNATPGLLELSTDRMRPAVQSFKGRRLTDDLSPELSHALKRTARAEGVTMFMLLLAAFKVLLYRYTGQEDISIGVPVANRSRMETEPLIGLFVNTLVMRTDLSGDPSFQELLSREKEVALGAYAHQDLPFERLVEELQPQRSLSHSPLFQILFIFQHSLRQALELREIAVTPLETETSTAKFDLTLSLEESEARLSACFEYNSDLFDGETIRRMAGHFRTLLDGVVSDPTQRISKLPLLTESETNQVLLGWNNTGRQYPSRHSILELIEAQVGSRPEATALECDGKYLSYEKLNDQANQLARYLRSLGVGPEQRVSVCMQRSAEMVVALLGILKAGAAYVPLDAAYPQLRLQRMVEDSGASVLLVDETGEQKLSGTKARVVVLTEQWPMISRESRENIASGVSGDNLAYVIYTSGSTGTPKGVAVRHASLVTLIHWAMEFFTADELRVVLASTSISFDISVIELFLTLSVGGKMIIVQDALHLRTLQSAEEITLINTVPSAVAELVRTGSIPAGVKTVCLAGEALQGRLAQQVYAQQSVSRVVNLYGPSEDTVYSTAFSIERGAAGEPAIGRPIANSQVYILDEWLQPVAIGVAGEIFIAGAGLARGYLNKADLTAERFIPDPFSKDEGGRMYRSGDVARYLADGNIQFIGRKDQQVKLRGYRIELGEIEAAITVHPQVSEAVVELRESSNGDKYLVGYLAGDEQLTASEIRAHLKNRLPDYMVPSRYVVMDHLPLSANGKLDRRALREMAAVLPESKPVAGPKGKRLGAVAEIVAGICSEVLGLDEVDAEANFFEMGGHSLLAAQVVSRVREAFNIDMGVRSVFENSTARGMSEVVERMLTAGRTNLDQPIRAVDKGERREMSPSQQRLWVLDRLEPGNSAYNIAAAIRLKGALDVAALERSLKEIQSRHEVLRTRYVEDRGLPVQELQEAQTIELRTIGVEDLPAEERETYIRRIVDEEANTGFDLSKGELMRAGLMAIAEDEHILTLVMHHIVSDGWSMGVLVRELSTLYNAYSAGQQSPLDPLPIQYSDYVLWQREWMSGAVLDQQLSYWKERLHATPELLELPTDRQRPAVQSFKGRRLTDDLGPELSHALKLTARAEGVTMFMLLIAAFKVLLYRYTGQEDISVGVPVANRSRMETESLIGLFVNTLVMRTDLSGDPSFQELLSREKEVALGAYAHQDLPFERLVEELQPQRSLSHPPLFQVWFNLLAIDELHAALELNGLVADPMATSEIQAKFDLSLYAFEHDQSIELQFVYNPDLFDDSTINKMLVHLRTLLESITASRDQRISQLNLLTEEEKSRSEAIKASSAFVAFEREPVDSTLTERFEQQVRMYPDNIAVLSKNRRWSYQELNAAANRIAGAVLERIGGPDQILGLLLSHDAPMIAALLGVLKAGNSYVPLDPSNPRQRIRYILEDSQSKAVLTDDANFELASSLIQGRLPIINIDELHANAPVFNQPDMTPDRMVYILYTSGSTGAPKGVVQNHRNVMHFIRNYTNNLKISTEDNLALLASHSFDAAVMDVYGALLNGATLCPLDLREAGIKGLSAWLIERQITIYHSTPTVYRYFVNELKGDESFPKLRLVVLGGEEVCKSDVEAYKRFFTDDCVLVNGFGPTESTVSLQFFVNKDTEVRRNSVPIGFPVDETEVLLLNTDGRESRVRGEIGIKSPYVALGYWRKPELTQTAFLSAQGATRIYRTGDMGRLRPDGSIEYGGRKDDQVKIRGMRVELGEIQSILCRHPAVRECIVAAKPGRLGETSLVAYVVARDGQIIDRTIIKQYLRDNLPAYMIPSALVTMDALPLTPTGKIDRRSLPAPDWSLRETEAEFVPAQTSTAQTLAEMWRELLSVDQIGINDNFFDLGGHSLLATRLASRIREILKIDVPLRSLFETQTLGDLSALIDTLLENDRGHSAFEIPRYSRDAYRVKDFQEMYLKARN